MHATQAWGRRNVNHDCEIAKYPDQSLLLWLLVKCSICEARGISMGPNEHTTFEALKAA